MTLETYTIEQLQAELERRNAPNDEARLFFADVLEAWESPLAAQGVRENRLGFGEDCAAITLIAAKFAELRAERKDGGWISWPGGECPVVGVAGVDVKFRKGIIATDLRARGLRWSHKSNCADIIAYRVL